MFCIFFKFSFAIRNKRCIFAQNNSCMNKDINRIKIILVEKKKTNRWLASKLGKDESTVSKWCTNTIQPSLEQLREIAIVLDTNVASLLCDSYVNDFQS